MSHMTAIQKMTAYDYFCEFAWERLEDVLGLNPEEGLPRFSPYIEFIEGCAFCCMYHLTEKDQEEAFGFSLKNISEDDLVWRFVDEYVIRGRRSKGSIL